MISRWQSLLLLLLSFTITVIVFSLCVLTHSNGNRYLLPIYSNIVSGFRNHETNQIMNSPPEETVMIQLRNGFFAKQSLYQAFTTASNNPFSKCKVNRCKYLPRNTTMIPGVLIFHSRAPPELPAKRLPSQKYIFFTRESEVHEHPVQVRYNLTMTHRRDSDIPVPHFYVEKRGDKNKQVLKHAVNFATGKPKKVAWVVSNCNTQSKREIYVNELKKYIKIDIYGKCGTLTCERTWKCWSYINATYKFYLAFENSICADYFTEKVKTPLRMGGIVPVVMGGANYSELLPPHSYIDVMDFPSPRALAEYLNKLDNNDTLYSEYFEWLGHYRIIDYLNNFHCGLCEYLHAHRGQIKVYGNIREWYDPTTRCRPGASLFKADSRLAPSQWVYHLPVFHRSMAIFFNKN